MVKLETYNAVSALMVALTYLLYCIHMKLRQPSVVVPCARSSPSTSYSAPGNMLAEHEAEVRRERMAASAFMLSACVAGCAGRRGPIGYALRAFEST